MTYLNISAYKFIDLPQQQLSELRQQLLNEANARGIKDTILLSIEGINLFLAAAHDAMQEFMQILRELPAFNDLWFKQSYSDFIPYKRMFVRIKKEIITMAQPHIRPQQHTAASIEPAELHAAYQENKDWVVLDTRNTYEVAAGSFKNAIHLNIENFRDFPAAIATLPASLKSKTIVTFCTGGIRCEKASAYMLEQGFAKVLQLKGGIINYFAECGNDFYEGDCFVFDNRGTVSSPSMDQ